MSQVKTSITAYSVASCIGKLASTPEWGKYIPEEMAELSASFSKGATDTPVKRLISLLPPKLAEFALDNILVPGMMHHFLFRKLLIEAELHRFMAETGGAGQVIILGAGLDTLAVRMAGKYPAARFFEVDLPGAGEVKLVALKRMGRQLPGNCRFLAADLAKTPLTGVLNAEKSFNSGTATLVILEGVLMYLRESDVKGLFTTLHALFSGQLEIIFGAMAHPDDVKNWRVRAANFLTEAQEKTDWHASSRDMPGFMASLGYSLKSWMPYKKLQAFYRPATELRNVPEEDENYYLVTKTPQSVVNFDIGQIPLLPINL